MATTRVKNIKNFVGAAASSTTVTTAANGKRRRMELKLRTEAEAAKRKQQRRLTSMFKRAIEEAKESMQAAVSEAVEREMGKRARTDEKVEETSNAASGQQQVHNSDNNDSSNDGHPSGSNSVGSNDVTTDPTTEADEDITSRQADHEDLDIDGLLRNRDRANDGDDEESVSEADENDKGLQLMRKLLAEEKEHKRRSQARQKAVKVLAELTGSTVELDENDGEEEAELRAQARSFKRFMAGDEHRHGYRPYAIYRGEDRPAEFRRLSQTYLDEVPGTPLPKYSKFEMGMDTERRHQWRRFNELSSATPKTQYKMKLKSSVTDGQPVQRSLTDEFESAATKEDSDSQSDEDNKNDINAAHDPYAKNAIKVLGIVKSQLPEFKVPSARHPTVEPFLESLEQVMMIHAGLLPEDQWWRAMAMTITKVDSRTRRFINDKIVRPQLSWSQLKKELRTFNHQDYLEAADREYEEISQGSSTVRDYNLRFKQFLHTLNRSEELDKSTVNNHYLKGLNASVREKYREKEEDSKIQAFRLGVAATSLMQIPLEQVMQSCEQIDIAHSRHALSRSLNNVDKDRTPVKFTHPGGSNVGSKRKRKYCIHHPFSSTHDTSECKNPRTGGRDKHPLPSGRQDNERTPAKIDKDRRTSVKCFACGGPHYASSADCPKRAVQASAAAQQKPTPVRALQLQQALGVPAEDNKAETTEVRRSNKRNRFWNRGGNKAIKEESSSH